jgi:hypothetical protein
MIKCNFVISLGCTKCCINRVHHLRRETKPGNLNLYKDANMQYLLFEWVPQAGLVICCYGNRTEQPTKCPDAQWFAIQQCYLEYGIWREYERHCSPFRFEGKGALLLNHLELSGFLKCGSIGNIRYFESEIELLYPAKHWQLAVLRNLPHRLGRSKCIMFCECECISNRIT